jgi:hypothetical protein
MAITLIYSEPREEEYKYIDPETGEETISTEIIQIQDEFSTKALKNTIYIKYDKKGNYLIQTKDSSGEFLPTTQTSFSLGNKNEHRVT